MIRLVRTIGVAPGHVKEVQDWCKAIANHLNEVHKPSMGPVQVFDQIMGDNILNITFMVDFESFAEYEPWWAKMWEVIAKAEGLPSQPEGVTPPLSNTVYTSILLSDLVDE